MRKEELSIDITFTLLVFAGQSLEKKFLQHT
jgi:hypothetical protein